MGCKTFGWLAAILAASIIAGLAVVPNASAAGPYDQPYGVQWSFVGGEYKGRVGAVEASPDGSVWLENGTGIKPRAYAQISPDGQTVVYTGDWREDNKLFRDKAAGNFPCGHLTG